MLERFRKMYPASNNEYQDHAFEANIDGKEKQIRIPTEIVREIHPKEGLSELASSIYVS